MTVYLFNVKGRGRRHRDLYVRATDRNIEPFFDLELTGPQSEMVPTIQPGTECIVSSYAQDRTHVIFKTYRFARFEERATNPDPSGQRYRVFLGAPGPERDDSMAKRQAAATPRYQETPRDLLTREETWINKSDLIDDFEQLPSSIPNAQLRAQVDNYFKLMLGKQIGDGPQRRRRPRHPTKTERRAAALLTIKQFPELIDYYIPRKEDTGSEATSVSTERVNQGVDIFLHQLEPFLKALRDHPAFYRVPATTFEEALERLGYLKEAIEQRGGWRIFYHWLQGLTSNGTLLRRLQGGPPVCQPLPRFPKDRSWPCEYCPQSSAASWPRPPSRRPRSRPGSWLTIAAPQSS